MEVAHASDPKITQFIHAASGIYSAMVYNTHSGGRVTDVP